MELVFHQPRPPDSDLWCLGHCARTGTRGYPARRMGIQRKKKRLPGYTQAIEHLGYPNEGYELYTFNMFHSPKPDNSDVAAIKGFEHRIEKRYLRKEGRVWYAELSAILIRTNSQFRNSTLKVPERSLPSMPTKEVLSRELNIARSTVYKVLKESARV